MRLQEIGNRALLAVHSGRSRQPGILPQSFAVLTAQSFQRIGSADLRPVRIHRAALRAEHHAGSVFAIAQDDSALSQIARDEFRRDELPITSEPRNLVWIKRDVSAVTTGHTSIAGVGELAITIGWGQISHSALLRPALRAPNHSRMLESE